MRFAPGTDEKGDLVCGQCCDQPCTVALDDFNRTDTSLGPNWTESGVSETNGNEAEFFTPNLATHVGVAGSGSHSASVRVRLGTVSVRARLLVKYVDASNYLFAEVLIDGPTGCARFRVVERVGGVDTVDPPQVVTSEITTDEWLALRICYDRQNEKLTGELNAFKLVLDNVADNSGTLAGLETLEAGNVLFDDFGFYEGRDVGYETCPDCEGRRECRVFRDDFRRPQPPLVLGCDWLEIVPSATIEMPAEIVRLTGGARYLAAHPQDRGEPLQYVFSRVRGDVAGSRPRILVDANQAGSVYHYAEIEYGLTSSTFRIGNTAVGVIDSAPIANLGQGSWSDMIVCFDRSRITATAYDSAAVPVTLSAATAANGFNYAGIASFSQNSSFDFWDFQRLQSSKDPLCRSCAQPCPACGDATPSVISATPAVPWGTANCPDPDICNLLNPAVPLVADDPVNPCRFVGTVDLNPPNVCNLDEATYTLQIQGTPGNIQVDLTIFGVTAASSIQYRATGLPNCNFQNTNLPAFLIPGIQSCSVPASYNISI